MADLLIKDLPEEVIEALQQLAARNRRSLQEELVAILQNAIQPGNEAAAPTVPPRGVRRGTRTIEELARELRLRHPEPIRQGPLGVDIIRKDRDSR
jgi:plasmid stability protein